MSKPLRTSTQGTMQDATRLMMWQQKQQGWDQDWEKQQRVRSKHVKAWKTLSSPGGKVRDASPAYSILGRWWYLVMYLLHVTCILQCTWLHPGGGIPYSNGSPPHPGMANTSHHYPHQWWWWPTTSTHEQWPWPTTTYHPWQQCPPPNIPNGKHSPPPAPMNSNDHTAPLHQWWTTSTHKQWQWPSTTPQTVNTAQHPHKLWTPPPTQGNDGPVPPSSI